MDYIIQNIEKNISSSLLWLKPYSTEYTTNINLAGKYTLNNAKKIVSNLPCKNQYIKLYDILIKLKCSLLFMCKRGYIYYYDLGYFVYHRNNIYAFFRTTKLNSLYTLVHKNTDIETFHTWNNTEHFSKHFYPNNFLYKTFQYECPINFISNGI